MKKILLMLPFVFCNIAAFSQGGQICNYPNATVASVRDTARIAICESYNPYNHGNSVTYSMTVDSFLAVLRNFGLLGYPDTVSTLATQYYVSQHGGWSLTGNAGTVDGTNFIGTTDNVPLNFKVNNVKAGRIDSALQSTFYGFQAGDANTIGYQNTFMGYQTAKYTSTGSYNVAIGTQSLELNTTGNENTALGAQVLFLNNGDWNIGIGNNTLNSNTTGSYNLSMGGMGGNTTGSYNTVISYNGFFGNQTGTYNTAIGYNCAIGASNLTNATAVGANAAVNCSSCISLGDSTKTIQVGIGYGTPSAFLSGSIGLAIKGKIALVDGTQSNGYVLKSSSTGLASWSASARADTSICYSHMNIDSVIACSPLLFQGDYIKLNSPLAMAYQYATPVTTDTVTANGKSLLVINPSGTLAVLSVSFPSSPVAGQVFQMAFTQIITIASMLNGTILGGITAAAANTSYKYQYVSEISKWVRLQ